MELREKLGIGTVQFGLTYGISNKKGQTSPAEVQKVLKTAKLYGIDMLDTASAYGNSEEVLGQQDISDFKLVSKFLPPREGQKIYDQLEKSLKDLGLKSLYGYLAHRPLEVLNHPEQWDELKALKGSGKIEKIGYSFNEPEELDKILDKGFYPDLIQVPYNYFDRRFEGLMEKMKSENCEVHTRSAFLQGLFFMKGHELSDYFDEVKPILNALQMRRPLNGALLKFVLENPHVDKVVVGVENEDQLRSNVEALEAAPGLPLIENKVSENILIPSRWPKK